jgi:hypothetical protein
MEFAHFAGVCHTTLEKARLFDYICAFKAQVDEGFQSNGISKRLADESKGNLLLPAEIAH